MTGEQAAPTAEIDAACTCTVYVVDYSDPERYHPENLDRELDPACPVHGARWSVIVQGAEVNSGGTVERSYGYEEVIKAESAGDALRDLLDHGECWDLLDTSQPFTISVTPPEVTQP